MIKGTEIDQLFESMLERMNPDPQTGYDREFWNVFEEHIAPAGLYDRVYSESGAVLIAYRVHLRDLAADWMKKVDDANDGLRHAARRERLGLPE